MLKLLSEGVGVAESCRRVGWSENAYRYHRRVRPMWAAECDAARSGARGGDVLSSLHVGFPEKVARFFHDRRPHLAHQLRIVEELKGLGPRDVLMVNIWPEAGKTATIEDYLCLEIADDPSLRVRYVSEASDLSKRVVGTVKRRFTDEGEYPEFIRKYGPFYTKGQEKEGRPWTTEQITVQRNPGTERDRNLVASSWTSAVYGSRIDLLILDDLCSQRNYNQSNEIMSRIRGTFFNRGLMMKTIIVGTRIGPGDFYEQMLDAGLVTRHVNIRASDTEGNPTVPAFWDVPMHHDGGACCKKLRPCPRDGSKVTPREFMELMRFESGEEVWWSSYMQTPQSNELTTFSEYLEKCLDHDRLVGVSA